MCRVAAFIGAEAPLSRLIYDPVHGLEEQAYRPREMVSGHVNVDGTGVAWWRPGDEEPLRYVTASPPWSDVNLPQLSRRLEARLAVGALRSATPGQALGVDAVPPFVGAGLAFAHNGYLEGFGQGAWRPLVDALPDDLHAKLHARVDSLVLFLTLVALRRERPELSLASALAECTRSALHLARREERRASLTFVAADGEHLVALRAAHGVAENTLYFADDGQRRWLASEALDPELVWQPVPIGTVLTLSGTREEPRSKHLEEEG